MAHAPARPRDMHLLPEDKHRIVPDPALAHRGLWIVQVAPLVRDALVADGDPGLLVFTSRQRSSTNRGEMECTLPLPRGGP